jgi:uncharacterized protein (DUF488 family)
MSRKIFTIGHGKHNFLSFIVLIQDNNINHIIDIRSIPYSRRAPWSNKSRLPELLRPYGIRYSYFGHKLGGKKQSIATISKQQDVTPEKIYNQAIQKLIQLSERDLITLLCAEEDPANCHRQHIVAQTLLKEGIQVMHILKNGALQEAWKEDHPAKQPNLL